MSYYSGMLILVVLPFNLTFIYFIGTNFLANGILLVNYLGRNLDY